MFPSHMLRFIVPALIVFSPTLFVLAQTERGPVPLPEGTWRPPSYSEQKERLPSQSEYQRRVPENTLDSRIVMAQLGSRQYANRAAKIVCINPFMVFLKMDDGRLYALNGTAKEAVLSGHVRGSTLERIGSLLAKVPKNGGLVTSAWIRAGLALCHGHVAKARRIAARANRLAVESGVARPDGTLYPIMRLHNTTIGDWRVASHGAKWRTSLAWIPYVFDSPPEHIEESVLRAYDVMDCLEEISRQDVSPDEWDNVILPDWHPIENAITVCALLHP